MFSPGKLNSITTFALNCSLFDRISDGNRVQKISTYYDYVTVILQIVIRLENLCHFNKRTIFCLLETMYIFRGEVYIMSCVPL